MLLIIYHHNHEFKMNILPSGCHAKVPAHATQATVLFPDATPSPLNGAPWEDVFDVMADRFAWEGQDLTLKTFPQSVAASNGVVNQEFADACASCPVFVAVGMHGDQSAMLVDHALSAGICNKLQTTELQDLEHKSSLGRIPVASLPQWLLSVLSNFPVGPGTAAKTWRLLQGMWLRRSSDDLAFLLLLAINDFVKPIPSTQVNMGDARSLVDMVTKCRKEIFDCVSDPKCKEALDKLSACGLNDQVCSYRVLASYESPLLEKFSRCVLQKHNCLRNSAEIPMIPEVKPLAVFRGKEVTWDVAEDIFLGHLASGATRSSPESFSWRVAAGKNPAYDYFPCQFQLWYRTRGKTMWYDPIFLIKTLDGRKSWRQRHYKVQRADTPGSFHFSVLDNGVTSKEYWRIMDCADDLEWAVFYYSGAASAAGITYRGALICTRSGALPTGVETGKRVDAALEACGIRRWEMFAVDHSCCADPPLPVPNPGDVELRAIE